MDLLCPRCSEPFEISELHEVRTDISFEERLQLFFEQGCGALLGSGRCAPDGCGSSELGRALWKVLGNDPDALAIAWADLL